MGYCHWSFVIFFCPAHISIMPLVCCLFHYFLIRTDFGKEVVEKNQCIHPMWWTRCTLLRGTNCWPPWPGWPLQEEEKKKRIVVLFLSSSSFFINNIILIIFYYYSIQFHFHFCFTQVGPRLYVFVFHAIGKRHLIMIVILLKPNLQEKSQYPVTVLVTIVFGVNEPVYCGHCSHPKKNRELLSLLREKKKTYFYEDEVHTKKRNGRGGSLSAVVTTCWALRIIIKNIYTVYTYLSFFFLIRLLSHTVPESLQLNFFFCSMLCLLAVIITAMIVIAVSISPLSIEKKNKSGERRGQGKKERARMKHNTRRGLTNKQVFREGSKQTSFSHGTATLSKILLCVIVYEKKKKYIPKGISY